MTREETIERKDKMSNAVERLDSCDSVPELFTCAKAIKTEWPDMTDSESEVLREIFKDCKRALEVVVFTNKGEGKVF